MFEHNNNKKPIVWTIAGSDSGGGAGIQTDLLTMSDLGVHGCSVITSLTAQNSEQVTQIEAVSDTMLRSQIQALADDLPPSAVKVGLILNRQQIRIIAECLSKLKQRHSFYVVLDPVMVATCGDALSGITLSDLKPLLEVTDLLTPNREELFALSGENNHVQQAANKLLENGVKALLVKGGHSNDPALAEDQYLSQEKRFSFSSPRVHTEHTHGTGCTLSSAIASAIALDYPIEDALTLAKAYINQGLDAAVGYGKGPGPVAHLGWPNAQAHFPHSLTESQHPAFACMDSTELGLYPVVDSVAWIKRLLACGVRTIQLRIKDPNAPDLEQSIVDAIALGREYKARLFINDYWQLAIKHDAYGVHLGQEDIETADLAAIQQAGIRLGLSTHGYYEIMRALAIAPSYIALGHIFPTKTKDMPSKPQGVERLKRYVELLSEYPTVAIGGINQERIAQVKQTGVGSIAVVTAITEADDPEKATRDLLQLVE